MKQSELSDLNVLATTIRINTLEMLKIRDYGHLAI